jgi:hypothetical protein
MFFLLFFCFGKKLSPSLTPALSQRERENCLQPSGKSCFRFRYGKVASNDEWAGYAPLLQNSLNSATKHGSREVSPLI